MGLKDIHLQKYSDFLGPHVNFFLEPRPKCLLEKKRKDAIETVSTQHECLTTVLFFKKKCLSRSSWRGGGRQQQRGSSGRYGLISCIFYLLSLI